MKRKKAFHLKSPWQTSPHPLTMKSPMCPDSSAPGRLRQSTSAKGDLVRNSSQLTRNLTVAGSSSSCATSYLPSAYSSTRSSSGPAWWSQVRQTFSSSGTWQNPKSLAGRPTIGTLPRSATPTSPSSLAGSSASPPPAPSLTGSRSAPQRRITASARPRCVFPRLFPTWYWRALGL